MNDRRSVRRSGWLSPTPSSAFTPSTHTQMDDSGVTGIGSNNVDNEPIIVDEQSLKRSPKRKANQSVVWDHFENLEKVPGQKRKAVCNYYGQIYTCDSNANGTSSMKTHIKLLCRQYEFSQFNLKNNPDKRQKTLAFEPVNGGGTGTVSKHIAVSFSVEACRKALAEIIILDELPFCFGETFDKVVEECLVEWGIDKFLTITINNAKSNDGIIDFLKKKIKKRDTTILDHEYLHVRCCAHILNLVVREGLKDVDVSIAKVHNIVRYVRSSPQRYTKFRSYCDKEKIVSKLVLCLDVATRWNATYFMLERAWMFQKAFERLEDDDNLSLIVGVREDEIGVESVDNELEGEVHGGLSDIMNLEKQHERGQGKGRGKHVTHGTPSSDNWNVVKMYVEVLKVFYILVEKLFGFFVYKEGMQKLFNWYEKKSVEHGKTQNVGESFRSEKNSKEYMNFCEEMDDEFERHIEEEDNMVRKLELERYWLEGKEDSKIHGDKFDVLAWLKVNSPSFYVAAAMVLFAAGCCWMLLLVRGKILAFEPVNGGGTGTVPKHIAVSISVEACRKASAEMIILDELSFRFVEGQGFKRFIYVVQSKWKNQPGRLMVAKDCMKIYQDGKKSLKSALKDQRICLTMETWTSLQNLNYMCLTVHFIDYDWKLHKKILNFCLVPNHKGETLGKVVEECLMEWGIDKFLTITIDNAKFNDGIIDFLKKKTTKRDATILDHEYLHVRYVRFSPQRLEDEDILSLVVGVREDEIGVEFVDNQLEGWSLNKHYGKSVVKKKVIEIKEGMLKLFNWYEKKSVEHGKAQNAGESFRSEKNSNEYMNFCEETNDEFERHMEEENNMVNKSELEMYWLESKEGSKVYGDKFDVLARWKLKS
ncbi:hypothetical protein RHSIM_Rhsim13G0111700 [Rhododendron simsii]|uniref:BED-type domain-containing protein n=1 Tax=Rhododendron simsii TaxID=118357 RepID=A0A834G0U6_RHOSS|nr:hypothetical protein RHSIM_Rhsim13G0111700 [Rhododendron simsii]